jgi:hypothetical protein
LLKSPLQPKGLRFELFPELFFSSMNKMDENKLPLSKFLTLIAQEQFFQKKTMFLRERRV